MTAGGNFCASYWGPETEPWMSRPSELRGTGMSARDTRLCRLARLKPISRPASLAALFHRTLFPTIKNNCYLLLQYCPQDGPVSMAASCRLRRSFASPRMSWTLLRVTGFVNTLHGDVTPNLIAGKKLTYRSAPAFRYSSWSGSHLSTICLLTQLDQ